jgi:predicted DNA-binding protein
MEELNNYISTLSSTQPSTLDNTIIEIYFENINDHNFNVNNIIELQQNNKDISDNIKKTLNHIHSNIKIKQNRYTNIIRDTYKDNIKVYTHTYKFIKSINISSDLNIIIFEVCRTYLNQEKFPNLNKYDITKTYIFNLYLKIKCNLPFFHEIFNIILWGWRAEIKILIFRII